MTPPGKNAPADRPLTVRLVLDAGNKEWILGKFAQRLAENLDSWNIRADIADHPSPDSDINHWMFYGYAWGFFFQEKRKKLTRSTVTVTHLDDPIKVQILRDVLNQVADIGICLSRMTLEDLVGRGFARDSLCYVTPGHDGAVTPRRTVIGITSRAYSDGRKREHLLLEMAESLRLDSFQFEIVGSGWEKVVRGLEIAGATVNYVPGTGDYKRDYLLTLERLRTCDYYLYLGLDEGSMGLLDALAAGVETIVTRQGFHLDIEDGVTHGFLDSAELLEIFRELSQRRRRLVNGVKELTWKEYARQHALLWRYLSEDRIGEISRVLHPQASKLNPIPGRTVLEQAKIRFQYYSNAWKSDFRKIYLDRRRWEIRSALSRAKRLVLK